MRRFFLTPSPLHGEMRILDVVAMLLVMVAFFPLRLVWNSDWALLAFPFGIAAAILTRRHVPDFTAGAQSGSSESGGSPPESGGS